jgi:ATP adenylyltransferase/5',5'''-P-1,P-4-tetraphosphate phosphorylase II
MQTQSNLQHQHIQLEHLPLIQNQNDLEAWKIEIK